MIKYCFLGLLPIIIAVAWATLLVCKVVETGSFIALGITYIILMITMLSAPWCAYWFEKFWDTYYKSKVKENE